MPNTQDNHVAGQPDAAGRVNREDRRTRGVAKPERNDANDPVGDTPDQDGIEIDNAIERPQEGQPGQPGGSADKT